MPSNDTLAAPAHPSVLVVEADEDLRAVVCAILGTAGYRASSAPDVQTARAALTTDIANVLLLSWEAHASRDGQDALLAQAVVAGTAVVLTSTSSRVAAIATELGVLFVSKPFDIAQFLATVQRVSQRP